MVDIRASFMNDLHPAVIRARALRRKQPAVRFAPVADVQDSDRIGRLAKETDSPVSGPQAHVPLTALQLFHVALPGFREPFEGVFNQNAVALLQPFQILRCGWPRAQRALSRAIIQMKELSSGVLRT
jgi:hypothetical protein